MSKAGVKFSEMKELLMKDKEFSDEYAKLKPRYDVISQIIEERSRQDITQEELALRVGTQKSNISRFENALISRGFQGFNLDTDCNMTAIHIK